MKGVANCDKSYAQALYEFSREYRAHYYLSWSITTGKQRSMTQNAALHLYCEMPSETLNHAGHERMVTTPIGQVSVPWTKDSVKENIWRPVQIALTKEQSTTAPLRGQYADIYDVIHRHMVDAKGISVLWPVKEDDK